ncbi:MAG: SDR family NAD(P)-dependent oxidoreductase [Bacilli bacterium]|nr:SDR family NAD(P)-dependent oxidoreductase [Bacilli bacterium]
MKKGAIKFLNRFNFKDVKDKTILITGGNSGVGFESARYCLYLGMKVILCARNIKRGEDAINKLRIEFPSSSISLMIIDLSEEESIKKFAKEIIDKQIDIDVFYHNAGVYRLPYQVKEGRELVISTNYFGPYMLTCLLLDYLHSLNHEVKMVITSSVAASWAKNDINMLTPNEEVSRMTRYSNSKLLDAYLFKYLLDNDESNIKYYLVHPGVTWTGLFYKTYKSKIFIKMVNIFMKLYGNSLWKSALSICRVLDKNAKEGAFYGPRRFFSFKGYPKENKFLDKQYLCVDEVIKKSEELLGYKLIK